MTKVTLGLTTFLVAMGCGSSSSPTDTGGHGGSGAQLQGGSGGSSAGSGASGASTAGGGNGAGMAGAAVGGSTGSGVTRGAVSLRVGAATRTCRITPEYLDYPRTEFDHPVTATTKAATLENGGTAPNRQPAHVSCTMVGTTDVYLDASISIDGPTVGTLLHLTASPLSVGQPAAGDLTVSGPEIEGQYQASPSGCTNTAIAIDPVAHSVWVEVACPNVVGVLNNDTCEFDVGYYYFENCTGS